VSSEDQNKRRPRSADTDFFERLAELDRDLPVTDHSEAAAPTPPAGAGPAERRRSSATAPRDPRPLIDLFPPMDEPELPTLERSNTGEAVPAPPPSGVLDEPVSEAARPPRVVGLAAALLLLVAAGATAAAYLFRKDLATILSAWQQTP
jgi:hypothetical protein